MHGHLTFLKTLLVDWNLNGAIQPFSILGFLLGDHATVFGIVLKGFDRDETLENRRDSKVGVPKQTKEGQDRHDDFDDDSTDSSVIPNGQEKEESHPPDGENKRKGRGILGNGERLGRTIGWVDGRFGPRTSCNLVDGIVQDSVLRVDKRAKGTEKEMS